jgi:hypothetical protein
MSSFERWMSGVRVGAALAEGPTEVDDVQALTSATKSARAVARRSVAVSPRAWRRTARAPRASPQATRRSLRSRCTP